MTIFAFFPHTILVSIVFFVTVDALVFREAEKTLFFMATLAGNRDMIASQFEVGALVVEGFRIQLHDVHIAALVVGVTGVAFPIHYIVDVTMKAGFLFYIVVNFFMTFAAERLLLGFVKGLMTLLTLFFDSFMPLNQITRLDQSFHALDRVFCLRDGNG
ncbi:MAG: hypothetical protein PVF82_18495 [Gammaproteobacteria bacterium]|jgi:hypothetical protein